ncbi:MAG TPA: hypothetical protein VNT20_00365 [Flavisolibacter sp.]|jgi:hypothetical protein|nr:hypothetical protein [Flavisolibacter sp.]
MRIYLSAVLLLVSIITNAQDLSEFTGHWEGELVWSKAGSKNVQRVKMQIIIQPDDTAGQYTWQIIYGDKGEDNRPYLLKPVDTAKGHWMIDERNGILIDQYWLGNRFSSLFSVQNSTIHDSYWIENNKLIAEFYGISTSPITTSGSGTEDVPMVKSYAIRTYQKAILKKKTK